MFLYRILIALVDWQSPLTVIITLISMEPLLNQNIMYMFNHSTVVRSMLIWYNSQWEWLIMYTNIVKQIFKDICNITNISISNYFYKYCCSFTFMHLANAFIQSNLQVNSGYNFFVSMCSLGIEPTTFCAANAMLYHWADFLCTTFRLSIHQRILKKCTNIKQHNKEQDYTSEIVVICIYEFISQITLIN